MIKKLVKSIKKRLLGVTSKELLDDLKLGGGSNREWNLCV